MTLESSIYFSEAEMLRPFVTTQIQLYKNIEQLNSSKTLIHSTHAGNRSLLWPIIHLVQYVKLCPLSVQEVVITDELLN